MNELISTCWDYCNKINYTIPSARVFGSPTKGDYGMIELDDDSKIAYIAFRGSDDDEDWKSNFKTKVTEDGYHTGFDEAAELFIDQYGFIPPEYKVIITGHSRGGALALLTAAKLFKKNLGMNIEVVTFGCPKVCTKASELYKEIKEGFIKHTYIVNGLDIVPRMPPEFPWSKDYFRVGDEERVGGKLSSWQKIKMIYYAIRGYGGAEWQWFHDHQPLQYDTEMKRAGLI